MERYVKCDIDPIGVIIKIDSYFTTIYNNVYAVDVCGVYISDFYMILDLEFELPTFIILTEIIKNNILEHYNKYLKQYNDYIRNKKYKNLIIE